MSQAEVADALGVSASTLAEWHRRGRGPHALAADAMLRYRPSDVADWLRDQIRTIDSGSKEGETPYRPSSAV
jgi:predicted site-specific integrase-resolvase